MKKVLFFLVLLLIPLLVKAEEIPLAQNAGSGILIEFTTGKVLYEKNINEKFKNFNRKV